MDDRSREVVLDVVIERKTIDDLLSSAMSNRYDRQKHVIKESGLRRPVYVIEGRVTARIEKMEKALTRRLVAEGIGLRTTDSRLETARFLRDIHHCLFKKLRVASWSVLSKTGKEFVEWNREASERRRRTLSEAFANQLMATRGVGVVRGAAVSSGVRTPAALRKLYKMVSGTENVADLLERLHGVPLSVSSKVCDLFTLESYSGRNTDSNERRY